MLKKDRRIYYTYLDISIGPFLLKGCIKSVKLIGFSIGKGAKA